MIIKRMGCNIFTITSSYTPLLRRLSLLLMGFVFIAGCSIFSRDTSSTIAHSENIDSIATAQAQVSEIEFSTPKPLLETSTTFEPWVLNNSYQIHSIDSADYSDLQLLESLLEGKRIVQLGEDDHRTSEQSSMKVRLIQYLRQELGYEVIAFESNLLDCYLTNENIGDLNAKDAMEHSIFRVWHTEEVLPLFEYIIETSSSSSPLILAGFDIQPSGVKFDASSTFYYNLLKDLDKTYASDIKNLEELFVYPANLGEFNNTINKILVNQDPVQTYDDLAAFIDQNQVDLKQLYPNSPWLAAVAEQSAWSRARYIELMQLMYSNQVESGMNVRAYSMAANVEFLAEELYPDKKIIIWTANPHITEEITVNDWVNMGVYLADSYGDDLFTIGLIGYRPPDNSLSLESLLHLYGKPYLFVDLSSQDEISKSTFEPMITGHNLPANEYYDALIFFDEITYPHYLKSD